jgi:hypothetical protein
MRGSVGIYNNNFEEMGVIWIEDVIAVASVEKRQQPSSEASGVVVCSRTAEEKTYGGHYDGV